MKNPIDLLRGSRSPSRDLQTEMQRLQSRMNRLIEDIAPWSLQPFQEAEFSPRCEVTEDKDAYHFKIDIPGVDKKNVKVELDDHTLTVSAERKEEKKEEGQKSFMSEVYYGSFSRSFALPSNIDEKKIDANFANGVLSLKVPKTESAQAKQIDVH